MVCILVFKCKKEKAENGHYFKTSHCHGHRGSKASVFSLWCIVKDEVHAPFYPCAAFLATLTDVWYCVCVNSVVSERRFCAKYGHRALVHRRRAVRSFHTSWSSLLKEHFRDLEHSWSWLQGWQALLVLCLFVLFAVLLLKKVPKDTVGFNGDGACGRLTREWIEWIPKLSRQMGPAKDSSAVKGKKKQVRLRLLARLLRLGTYKVLANHVLQLRMKSSQSAFFFFHGATAHAPFP